MARERTGFIVKRSGKLYVRICYTDAEGKRRELMRRAEDRATAKTLLKKLIDQLDQPATTREQRIEGDKLTFAELADIYEERRITEPQYQGDRKVSGMRSWKRQLSFLKVLRQYFGKKRIREITLSDLEQFKRLRLKTPTRRGSERSFAHVNRELSLLRTMLAYATRQDWIQASPFEKSESLISHADEVKRDRVLSFEEEARLLAVCVEKREHLRICIIAAVDTGLRKNELFTLVWGDVFLLTRTIQLKAFNSKTAKPRVVPISERLAVELEKLKKDVSDDNELVFACGDIKRSFATACRLADIHTLRWHDLRHSFASRLAAAGVPLTDIARLLGHATVAMTFRYSNQTAETLTKAAAVLNSLNTSATPNPSEMSTTETQAKASG